MKRNVWIFGLILGLIITGNTLVMMTLCYNNPYMHTNDTLGYVAMVVVFSLIFFGIRNYRNKELGGVISLGKAFKTGALIALVASTMYVVIGLSYMYLFIPDFIDKYVIHVLDKAAKDHATAQELADKTRQMADFKEMYKNPVFAVLISYMEVLPIGLVVAFISALVLKRKTKPGTTD